MSVIFALALFTAKEGGTAATVGAGGIIGLLAHLLQKAWTSVRRRDRRATRLGVGRGYRQLGRGCADG